MSPAVRLVLIGLSLTFVAVGIYHRIRAAQSGDRLDRTKEGWPILIGVRLFGFATFGLTAAWLWNPQWFAWAAFPVPALGALDRRRRIRLWYHMADMDVHLTGP